MSILIREYLGCANNQVDNSPPMQIKEAGNNIPIQVSKESLMVEIEAIHAYPHATRNFTRYMPQCLKKSIPTWTYPYRRPMIKFHNEKDGEIIGRICVAEYKTKDTFSDTPALVFTANIADLKAVEDVKNNLLETVSIGIIAHVVKCSICGADIAAGEECDHERGETYKTEKGNEVCYWDIYDMEGKECSYVIVPSDIYAKNKKIYRPSGDKLIIESLISNKTHKSEGKSEDDMTPEEISALQESLKAEQVKVAVLEAEKVTLKESVTALTAEKETTTADLTKVKTDLTEAQTKLTTTEAALADSKVSFETEKGLKESLELQLQTEEKAKKTTLVETVVSLRKAIGGKTEIDVTLLEGRSVESLGDSIKDLEEELKLKNFNPNKTPGAVMNPSLTEDDKTNSTKKVDKDEDLSNMNIEEGLQQLFGGVADFHNRK